MGDKKILLPSELNKFMLIEPIVFFDLIIAIFILVSGLTIFALLYVRALNKLNSAKIEEEQLKEKMSQKSTTLLESARDRAFELIKDATIKAKDILSETKIYEDKSKQVLNFQLEEASKKQVQALEKASLDILKDYKEDLERLRADNINIVKNISKDIERDVLNEFKDFKEILRRETVASQRVIEEKLEEDYKAVDEEINTYKQQKLKEVDDSIYDALARISEMVLGKAIDSNTHQELILDALNKAKSDIVKMK